MRLLSVISLVLLMLSQVACDSSAEKTTLDFEDRLSDSELQNLKPAKGQDHSNLKTLYFGFDLRSSPQEDSRQYLPFLNYLEKTTGYHFQLRFTPSSSTIIDELGSGKVQFAAIGAVSFIQGNALYGIKSLARGVNSQGRAEYQSMIVVSPESKIQRIEDLKNRRFAFGNESSTQGHLIPRIMLQEHNLDLSDFQLYEYLGSHQKCADAVIAKAFDACGMQDTMAKDLAEQGLIRILQVSRYYPSSGIAVNKDVPEEVVAKVRQALLEFEPQGVHANGLYHWDRTEMPKGFKPASMEDYKELKEWDLRFGMLSLDEKGGGSR